MTIPAAFESTCPACHRPIHVDDPISLTDDGQWVHAICLDRPVDDAPRNPTCPHCFIQHAGPCA